MEYDAILGLACSTNKDGSLSNRLESRVVRSIEIYKQGVAPKILFSGGSKEATPHSSGMAMALYAVSQGVAQEDILLDEKSWDTVGHGIFPKLGFFEKHGMRRILVITNAFHAERSKQILEFCLGLDYEVVIDDLADTSDEIEKQRRHETRAIGTFYRLVEGIERGDTQSLIERVRKKHGLYKGLDETFFTCSSESPYLGFSLEDIDISL